MRYIFILLALIFFTNTLCSQEQNVKNLPYKKKIKENILKGQIFCESKVKSFSLSKEQSLTFSVAGLHSKNCNYAFKTLSRYEDYSKFVSFIKSSRYDELTQTLDFQLSHFLLPFDMQLIFNLPRISGPGTYPFSFDVGIFKNLKGTIFVGQDANKCLFYTTAQWQGEDTGVNNTILEVFSEVLSRRSMEILFRISSSLSH
jgi:hypothetical protein